MRAVSWCKNADSKHFIWNSTSELRRDIGELKYRRCSLEDASLFIIIDLSVTSIFKNSPSRSDSYIWTPDLTLKISNYVSIEMLSARVGLKDWFILCWKNYHFIPNLHNTRKNARVFHRIFVGNVHWSLRYCRTIQNSVLWSNIETLKITLKSDCIYPCAIWKAKEKPIILHHNIFHAVRSVQACIRVGDIHTRF